MTEPKRFNTIDVMRGITVALMIFVNASGLSESYAFFAHAPWEGCTLADWVFPSFLFIVGFSIGLALLQKPYQKGWAVILKRVVILFLCGLALNFLFRPDIEHVRIMGVLQRIAICYGVVAFLALKTKPFTQGVISVGVLLGYWLLLLLYPVPHVGADVLTAEGNLASDVDSLLLHGHMLKPYGDPEGLLSTLPAIAQTLLGLLTYHLFSQVKQPTRRILVCTSLGLLLCVLGAVWGVVFPMNKFLWTSSYVLWTTGITLLVLTGIYVCVDLKAWHGLNGFKIMGQQALLFYIVHLILIKLQLMITLGAESMNLKDMIILKALDGLSIQNATLLYAVFYTFIFVCFGLTFSYRDLDKP